MTQRDAHAGLLAEITARTVVMAAAHLPDRPKVLLWLNTAARISARMERGVGARAVSRLAGEEATVRPEDTLREAGISTKRQATYQRRMSSLLAGR